jgi:hypothetical protein
MIHNVEDLLCEIFQAPRSEGTHDQAEYILSMTDPDDIREWILAVFGEDQFRLEEFMERLDLIRKSDQPVISKIVGEPPKPQPQLRQPRYVPAPQEPPVPREPPPRISRPVPAARSEDRTMCPCLAQEHDLIGNCLQCGRIVCELEDYGDCLFCHASKDVIHWNDVSAEVKDQAIDQKNRLIQYDREGSQRTRVYDDATDWYAEADNVWRGKEEREAALRAAEQFERMKLDASHELKISLDFNSGAIAVVDKSIGMNNVIMQEKDALHAFTNLPSVEEDESRLDAKSKKLLDSIQSMCARKANVDIVTKPSELLPVQHVSLFSFLDEEANLALDSL